MDKTVLSAAEAVRRVRDGMTVATGGFGVCGVPSVLLAALADQGSRDLELVSNNCGIAGVGNSRLLENGQIRRLVASYVGENKELERPVPHRGDRDRAHASGDARRAAAGRRIRRRSLLHPDRRRHPGGRGRPASATRTGWHRCRGQPSQAGRSLRLGRRGTGLRHGGGPAPRCRVGAGPQGRPTRKPGVPHGCAQLQPPVRDGGPVHDRRGGGARRARRDPARRGAPSGHPRAPSTRARTCHLQDTATVAGRIYRESRARAKEQPSSRPRASQHPLQIYPLVRELAADRIPVAVTSRVLKIARQPTTAGSRTRSPTPN